MAKLKNDRQERFCQEYIIDLKGTQAAIRAGYSPKTANEQASRLLANVNVQARYQELIEKRSERTEIKADDVLRYWHDIATADPNEIIHLRRVCCRHCYGIDHQYQWISEEEYQKAVEMAKSAAKEEEKPAKIPSDAGGYGFNPLFGPHAQCPYCWGEGHMEVHAEDTRFLSPKAKRLYAGVKQTRDGFEVKMRDQDKAMENVARHLGMFVERKEVTGAGGGPIQIESPEQRQKRIEALLKKRDEAT
ncbi:MAG: terminase small subunit [Bacteroidales bacterium]|nr:terminase small subunit [Bacteroidales bacterium]